MNYWGISGTVIVNSKVKALIERYYGTLQTQFLPCICSNCQDTELWIWNVCEYHDVLDVQKAFATELLIYKGKKQ